MNLPSDSIPDDSKLHNKTSHKPHTTMSIDICGLTFSLRPARHLLRRAKRVRVHILVAIPRRHLLIVYTYFLGSVAAASPPAASSHAGAPRVLRPLRKSSSLSRRCVQCSMADTCNMQCHVTVGSTSTVNVRITEHLGMLAAPYPTRW